MTKTRRKKQTGILLNRILLLLMVAIVTLTAVILLTNPPAGQLDPAKNPPDSVPPPSSATPPPSVPDSTPEPTSQPESQSQAPEASSESQSASEPSASPASQSGSGSSTSASSAANPDDPYYEAALPLLVNPTNKIPDDYQPDVADMGNGYSYDKKATRAYNELLKKAKADGISLWVLSAYRSFDKQTTNFQNKIKEYENLGYNAEQAYAATAKLIAVPGTSEHSLGLALDLNSLETSFESTKAFEWLIANCADFGFILRYPKDKVEITGISYEPWHYRYVGTNHAKPIMEQGICLEEYLSGT